MNLQALMQALADIATGVITQALQVWGRFWVLVAARVEELEKLAYEGETKA